MSTRHRKVLLIEDEDFDIEIVNRFLSMAGEGEFVVSVAKTVAAATDMLQQKNFDLILLDQMLPDSLGDQTFFAVRDGARGTPIIVLTGLGDDREGAKKIRMGAQDYLIKGRFDAFLLVRVMRYAIERWEMQREIEDLRLREKLALEFQALEEIARTLGGRPNPRPLKDSSPLYFQDLVQRYGLLLDQAMQRRIYHIDSAELNHEIKKLTHELARIKGGPREIVEIHSAALQMKLNQQTEIKNQVYLEEGRLLLLETMGAMVKIYRNFLASPASDADEVPYGPAQRPIPEPS